jgi:O-antigen/teichoic acid export membrane protein
MKCGHCDAAVMSSAIGKHISWQGGSVVIQAILQITMMSVFAKHIPPEAYGALAVANIFLAFVTLFATDGVAAYLVSTETIDEEKISAVGAVSVGCGLLMVAFSFVIAPYYAQFFNSPESAFFIKILAIVLIISAFSLPIESRLQREKRFDTLAKINVGSFVVGYFAVGIFCIYAGMGVWSIIAATVAQSLIKLVMLFHVAESHLRRRNFSREVCITVLLFARSMIAIKFVQYLLLNIDKVIIGKKLDLSSMGSYQMYSQIVSIPSRYIGNVLDSVIFSHMSRMIKDRGAVKLLYKKTMTNIVMVFVPLAVLLWFISFDFLYLFLGEEWVQHYEAFQFLVLSIVFRLIYRVNNVVIRAHVDLKRSLYVNLAFLLLLVTLLMLLADHGLQAVAVAVASSFACCCIFQLMIMNRYMLWQFADLVELAQPAIHFFLTALITVFLSKLWSHEGPIANIGLTLIVFSILSLIVAFWRQDKLKNTLLHILFSKNRKG